MRPVTRIKFVKEKETRNTVRYSESSTSFVGTLYIRKETFNGRGIPLVLFVTIEAE